MGKHETLVEPRGAPVRMIPLPDIEIAPKRMRALRPKSVDAIAESIQARGRLLQPVVVRPRRPQKGDGERYWLVAGRHRFEAVRKLGHDRIAATILDGLDADAALLAEIDENLIRANLSPAERAAHVARRKELYERLHPETRQGGQPGAGRGKKSRSQTRQNGDTVSERFTKDTSKKTGKSERAIQRDAQRGKDCAVLDDIVGTSLDKGDEIDALAKLSPDEQRKLAEQAKSGAKVSAKTPAPAPSAHEDIGPDSASEIEEPRRPPASAKEMTALIAQVVARLWKWSDADERRRHKIIQILEHAGRLIWQLAGDSESLPPVTPGGPGAEGNDESSGEQTDAR